MIHEFKLYPPEYNRMIEGRKTFDVQLNQNIQMGDSVIYKEWDPANDPEKSKDKQAGYEEPIGYTGRPDLKYKLGFIQNVSGNAVMSLLPWEEPCSKTT